MKSLLVGVAAFCSWTVVGAQIAVPDGATAVERTAARELASANGWGACAADEFFLDREAVTYDKDGHGSVRYW